MFTQLDTILFSISIVFVYRELNVKTVLFQTIQFSINTVSMSKKVLFQTIQFSISTQFNSTWPIDRALIKCYHFWPEWTWEWWQWRGAPHSPKLQYHWNLTIRLFRIISGHSLEVILPQSSWCILQPQPTGQYTELNYKNSFISNSSV